MPEPTVQEFKDWYKKQEGKPSLEDFKAWSKGRKYGEIKARKFSIGEMLSEFVPWGRQLFGYGPAPADIGLGQREAYNILLF